MFIARYYCYYYIFANIVFQNCMYFQRLLNLICILIFFICSSLSFLFKTNRLKFLVDADIFVVCIHAVEMNFILSTIWWFSFCRKDRSVFCNSFSCVDIFYFLNRRISSQTICKNERPPTCKMLVMLFDTDIHKRAHFNWISDIKDDEDTNKWNKNWWKTWFCLSINELLLGDCPFLMSCRRSNLSSHWVEVQKLNSTQLHIIRKHKFFKYNFLIVSTNFSTLWPVRK